MPKHLRKLARVAVVLSTLAVLASTAAMPAAYAVAGITPHMVAWCQNKGYTSAAYGWTPGTQFKKDAQGNWYPVPGTGQYGYFCSNGNLNSAYEMIPASEQH